MTNSMLSRRQFRTYAACLHSRSSARHVKRRRCTLRMEGLEDRAVPATFHVALTGNDITGNGSIATPFRTVQAGINAAAATADGNDIVKVEAGTYATAGVDLGLSIPSSANLHEPATAGRLRRRLDLHHPHPRSTVYVFQNAGRRQHPATSTSSTPTSPSTGSISSSTATASAAPAAPG